MPLPAQQLQALADAVVALGQASASLTASIQAIPSDAETQAELDGVNARLEAISNQVAIALTVAADATYSDAQKVELITATLGPQA